MPYNKRFLKYVIKNKIINGSPKFKLYQFYPETGESTLIRELPAQCEYIETTTEVGVKCTATDTGSDSYIADLIQLHVNTYTYIWAGKTYSDTEIDTARYVISKGKTDQLKIEDKVTFTSPGYAEV